MQRLLLIFFSFLIISFDLEAQDNEAVLFGNHSELISTNSENVYRIFMDKNGDYYPEDIISNADLRKMGDSQLVLWAMNHPSNFTNIAKNYQLTDSIFSPMNYKILQDSIVAKICRDINKSSLDRDYITFLFHGFRKEIDPARITSSITSQDEYAIVEDHINYKIQETSSKNYYVEVYWDGKYRSVSPGFKNIINLAKLFRDEAIPNAQNAGLALRKVLAQIQKDSINLISHSTGTHVVSSLLFNTLDCSSPTPNQKNIKVALIASASSGKKLFRDYYQRKTALDYNSTDNYSIANVYKKQDPVLRKKNFAPFYGNTTLGCNYAGESHQLARYFRRKFKNSCYMECEVVQSKNQVSHSFVGYVRSEEFGGVLGWMFGGG